MPETINLQRRKPYTLNGEPTAETVERVDEMLEELYDLLVQIGTHDILSSTHSDTRIDPEHTQVLRGDVLVGQQTPQGADRIKWQRFAIGAAHTVLKTTDGVDLSYGKVILTSGATQEVTGILPVANGGSNNSAFTAGSVIFAGPSGTQLVEDNANFFWDDTNNRLGLGINTPTVLLDVVNSGLAAVLTPTVRLANTTAATSGTTRQFSPALIFSGAGWDTDGGGSSTTVRAALYARTVSASAVTPYLAYADDQGSGVFADQIYLGVAIAGQGQDLRFRDGNLVFRNSSRGLYFVSAPLTDAVGSSHFITATTTGKINLTPLTGGSEAFVEVEQNVFGIATGTIPALRLRCFDNSTATPQPGLLQRAVPGGTAAVGFGSSLWFQASSSTTSNQDQGYLDCVWNVATHATRSADFVLRLVDNAAAVAEKYRFASTGLATIPSVNVSSGALGNIRSDVYTPTRSAEANLDANVTMSEAQWMRVRNTVTVSGRFTADPTVTLTATSFEITLPIASNLGAAEDVAGVAFCGTIAGQGAEIIGVAANDTAKIQWVSGDVTSQTWSYTFTYQII